MVFLCTTFALALAGAVQATLHATSAVPATSAPVHAMTIPDGAPVLSLEKDSVTAHPNYTLGDGVLRVDSKDATYPASIIFCTLSGCGGSCTSYDLQAQPHSACLTPRFDYGSVYIYQPSGSGLPFGVYTGPSGCASFAQIPGVNQCYDAHNYVGWDFELYP